MNVTDLTERNGLFADAFEGVTPDQAIAVLQDHGLRSVVAEIVATRSAADAMKILDIPQDVQAALADYVKPRWPEVF